MGTTVNRTDSKAFRPVVAPATDTLLEVSGRLWPRVYTVGTVPTVFLVAAVDLLAAPRRASTAAAAKALRRVGAEVVVLVNCEHGSATRIKKEARYGDVSSSTGEPAVAVLSNGRITRQLTPEGLLICETRLGGNNTSIAAIRRRRAEVCTLTIDLAHIDQVVVCGEFDDDLNDPVTHRSLHDGGFVDTRERQITERERHDGIIVKGLRTYGHGEYLSEDGVLVRWARLGQ